MNLQKEVVIEKFDPEWNDWLDENPKLKKEWNLIHHWFGQYMSPTEYKSYSDFDTSPVLAGGFNSSIFPMSRLPQ